MIRKTILGLSSAAILAAGTVALPSPANAFPGWVVPAIVGAGVVGVVIGAGASRPAYATDVRAYEEPVYAAPVVRRDAGCRVARERINGRLRTVEICPIDHGYARGYGDPRW